MRKLAESWAAVARPLRPSLEALAVGVALGLWDIHSTGRPGLSLLAYLLAGVVLGARHAGRAWLCWPPLGLSLYVIHLAAIAHGYKQPYVEANALEARATLTTFPIAGLGIALGVGVRLALSAWGWFRRPDGSPVRIVPRTPWRIVATVVVGAVLFKVLSWIAFDLETVRAPGFTEFHFRLIREGMPAETIEAILGPPLDKIHFRDDETETWRYTNQTVPTGNFHRRWLYVKDGKVELVISDYWWD